MRAQDAVVELAHRLSTEDRAVHVIAVDGHSAAGKSTLAGELVDFFGAAQIPGDDFYRVTEPNVRRGLNPEQGASLYYDWERMLDEALRPLRNGQAARYRPYDWDRNCLSEHTCMIEPATVVVVEGLFVSRPELHDVVDVSVLVVAPSSVRRQRQIDRADATQGWLERWDAAECWYFEHVRRDDSFDFIVHGIPDRDIEHLRPH